MYVRSGCKIEFKGEISAKSGLPDIVTLSLFNFESLFIPYNLSILVNSAFLKNKLI